MSVLCAGAGVPRGTVIGATDPKGYYATDNVYSVTELEKAAECPFRFFLKRGLGIRPVDDRERDKDVWLDPLTRGSELHEVYATLLRRVPAADMADAHHWLILHGRCVCTARVPRCNACAINRWCDAFLSGVVV